MAGGAVALIRLAIAFKTRPTTIRPRRHRRSRHGCGTLYEVHIEPLTAARPLTIAHRAGNDPARAHIAYEAGADLIEADLWLYRGRLEVRHTKTMPLVSLLWDRWSIEPGWRPRFLLNDLLSALPPDAGLMLDLKGNDARLSTAVLHALEARSRNSPVAVCSQHWAHVDSFAGHPGITPLHSVGKAHRLQPLFAHLESHKGGAPAAISIHQRLLDPDTVRRLKDFAAHIMTWPINDMPRARELTALGVDGVITDNIEVVRQLVAERSTSA
jgi:glycerophosphoryl diester phosphodiesterase